MKRSFEQRLAAAEAEAIAALTDYERAGNRYVDALHRLQMLMFHQEQDLIARIEAGASIEDGRYTHKIVRQKVGKLWVKRLRIIDASTGKPIHPRLGRLPAELVKSNRAPVISIGAKKGKEAK